MYKDKSKQKEANKRAKQRERKGMTGKGMTTEGMTLNPKVAEAIEVECLARRRKGLPDDRDARYVRALRYQREQSGEVIFVSEIMRSNLIGVERPSLRRMIDTFQESSHPEYMCDVRLGVFGPTLDILAEVKV